MIFLVAQVIVTISFSHNRICNQHKYMQILSKTPAASFKIHSSLWFVIRRCHNRDYTASNDKIASKES